MPVELTDWITDAIQSSNVWYVKRLSGNDTLANGAHQAGPYIPKEFLFDVFPVLNRPEKENPDVWFDLYVESHADHRKVRAIWYNNGLRGGTRNEARITQLGGQSSALLDPESTGALVVFAFSLDSKNAGESCRVWVCRHETEEDLIEEKIGPVEPGSGKVWKPDQGTDAGMLLEREVAKSHTSCWIPLEQIPPTWLVKFPTGSEIIRKSIELRADYDLPPDRRILARRECEFEIFRSLEEAVELPLIIQGFTRIEDFLARAQTVLQRRKARSGRSLELHAREIFIEEGLKEDENFSYQPESDLGKNPDFIFPSERDYKNPRFPKNKLRMMAVKTTCKDRWRQILKEAKLVTTKHLLTIQEGVSENQFREMAEANVVLVVPKPLIKRFPKKVRPHLQTLESFIGDVKLLI